MTQKGPQNSKKNEGRRDGKAMGNQGRRKRQSDDGKRAKQRHGEYQRDNRDEEEVANRATVIDMRIRVTVCGKLAFFEPNPYI